MRSVVAAVAACVVAAAGARAECPADALGTARTITVDPTQQGRVGTMQYGGTLPLDDKEVVLTFDDGPVPPYSNRILDALAEQCVKATFFIVGRQAREFPDVVRRVYDDGHTVATHSENHPRAFDRLSASRVVQEIDGGLAWTATALGEERAAAPFFRAPGLRTSSTAEAYLASHAMTIWSADVVADDWRRIPAREVIRRALKRLAAKGKGVLLLHDIQPATALALPELLHELKAGGYRIVHVVPAAPAKVPGSARLVLAEPGRQGWPRIPAPAAPPQLPVPSRQSFGWPDLFSAKDVVATAPVRLKLTFRPGYQTVRVTAAHWPAPAAVNIPVDAVTLPVPSPQSFGMPHPFGPNIALPLPGPVEPAPPASVDPDAPPAAPAAWPQEHDATDINRNASVPVEARAPHHPVDADP